MKQKLIKKLIIGFVAMSSCCVAQSFVGLNQTFAMTPFYYDMEINNNKLKRLSADFEKLKKDYRIIAEKSDKFCSICNVFGNNSTIADLFQRSSESCLFEIEAYSMNILDKVVAIYNFIRKCCNFSERLNNQNDDFLKELKTDFEKFKKENLLDLLRRMFQNKNSVSCFNEFSFTLNPFNKIKEYNIINKSLFALVQNDIRQLIRLFEVNLNLGAVNVRRYIPFNWLEWLNIDLNGQNDIVLKEIADEAFAFKFCQYWGKK